MSETINNQEVQESNEEQSSLNFETIYTTLILNWKWYLLSVFICLGIAFLYLRYTTPIYNTTAKLLIKDDDNKSGSARGGLQALESMSNLGIISNSYGVENEEEILTSSTIAEQAVRDLKLYVNYYVKGNVKNKLVYKEQPINVNMDFAHLDKLNAPITLKIERDGNTYNVEGTYSVPLNEIEASAPIKIEKTFNTLPALIRTRIGVIFIGRRQNHDSHHQFTKIDFVCLRKGSYRRTDFQNVFGIQSPV